MRTIQCWPIALLVAAAPLHALDGDAAAQRERIARERAAIETRFRDAQARCTSRFAVTSCVDRARAERRRALEPLERESQAIDAAERERRAAERLRRIEQKAAQQARAPASAAPPREPKAPPAPASGRPAHAGRSDEPSGPSAAQQARSEAAYEQRQRRAQAHREAVERRNAERAQKHPPAPPLPASAAER